MPKFRSTCSQYPLNCARAGVWALATHKRAFAIIHTPRTCAPTCSRTCTRARMSTHTSTRTCTRICSAAYTHTPAPHVPGFPRGLSCLDCYHKAMPEPPYNIVHFMGECRWIPGSVWVGGRAGGRLGERVGGWVSLFPCPRTPETASFVVCILTMVAGRAVNMHSYSVYIHLPINITLSGAYSVTAHQQPSSRVFVHVTQHHIHIHGPACLCTCVWRSVCVCARARAIMRVDTYVRVCVREQPAFHTPQTSSIQPLLPTPQPHTCGIPGGGYRHAHTHMHTHKQTCTMHTCTMHTHTCTHTQTHTHPWHPRAWCRHANRRSPPSQIRGARGGSRSEAGSVNANLGCGSSLDLDRGRVQDQGQGRGRTFGFRIQSLGYESESELG